MRGVFELKKQASVHPSEDPVLTELKQHLKIYIQIHALVREKKFYYEGILGFLFRFFLPYYYKSCQKKCDNDLSSLRDLRDRIQTEQKYAKIWDSMESWWDPQQSLMTKDFYETQLQLSYEAYKTNPHQEKAKDIVPKDLDVHLDERFYDDLSDDENNLHQENPKDTGAVIQFQETIATNQPWHKPKTQFSQSPDTSSGQEQSVPSDDGRFRSGENSAFQSLVKKDKRK